LFISEWVNVFPPHEHEPVLNITGGGSGSTHEGSGADKCRLVFFFLDFTSLGVVRMWTKQKTMNPRKDFIGIPLFSNTLERDKHCCTSSGELALKRIIAGYISAAPSSRLALASAERSRIEAS
jgi:hypothetical protein